MPITLIALLLGYILIGVLTNVLLSYIHGRWHTHENWYDEYGNRTIPEEEIAWQSMLWLVYIPMMLVCSFFALVWKTGVTLSTWVISKTRPE